MSVDQLEMAPPAPPDNASTPQRGNLSTQISPIVGPASPDSERASVPLDVDGVEVGTTRSKRHVRFDDDNDDAVCNLTGLFSEVAVHNDQGRLTASEYDEFQSTEEESDLKVANDQLRRALEQKSSQLDTANLLTDDLSRQVQSVSTENESLRAINDTLKRKCKDRIQAFRSVSFQREKLQREVRLASNEIASLRATNTTLHSERQAAFDKVAATSTSIDQLSTEFEHVSSQLVLANRQSSDLAAQVQATSMEIATLRATNNDLRLQIIDGAALEAKNDELRREIQQARAPSTDIEALRATICELRSTNDELHREIESVSSQLEESKLLLSELTTEVEGKIEAIGLLDNEVNTLTHRLLDREEDLAHAYEARIQAEVVRSSAIDLEDELSTALMAELNMLDTENARLNGVVRTLEGKLRALTEWQSSSQWGKSYGNSTAA